MALLKAVRYWQNNCEQLVKLAQHDIESPLRTYIPPIDLLLPQVCPVPDLPNHFPCSHDVIHALPAFRADKATECHPSVLFRYRLAGSHK